MEKTVEGSKACAEVAVNCGPEVVAAYPITPTADVAHTLEKYYSDGELKTFIAVEAEFSALSCLIGGAAAGARTFTSTGSQGLLLMHEAVFCAAGMRLPIVMLIGNRAVSAPLNIWNDEQDSISQRDAGWIQIYCASNQEAVDSIPQAFKIAEQVMLPVMVCVDGHYLTHSVETIDIPSREQVSEYLPDFNPKIKLDPENPLTLGAYANPVYYQDFREDLHKDLLASKTVIKKEGESFGKMFDRHYGLTESYNLQDVDFVFVCLGSVYGNAKAAVDELRKEGVKAGVFRIRCFRPFPRQEARNALQGKTVGVFEKDFSAGAAAPVYSEIKEALYGTQTKVSSFMGGLGGRDVTRRHVKKMFGELQKGKEIVKFVTTQDDGKL